MNELNYTTYLKVDELLSLQQPVSEPEEHDEMLFIVFHQISELWFKQLLHELDHLCETLHGGHIFRSISALTRITRIMTTLVNQTDILETLTPLGFNAFRDRLETASGFQSMQFREIELLLGLKGAEALSYYESDMPGLDAAQRRLESPSLVDYFYGWLVHHGADLPEEVLTRDMTTACTPHEQVSAEILRLYRSQGELRVVFELLADLDSGLQTWRYRHLKMVQRTIGNKPGTAGSLGLPYLEKSLFLQAFPDIWAIRHQM
ncbi:MAG: tryptophan 2,3-dioxygenase [Acidimicrobiales bacterium]|nr:tryptophan 2,3-dioxygenase [Acidimicrobiales bacterium]